MDVDFLKKLRIASNNRQVEWTNGENPSLTYRGNELAGETGEACNIIKKLERERLGWRGSKATKEQLAEELADVIICVDLISQFYDFDLETIVRNKFNKTSEKYGFKTKL